MPEANALMIDNGVARILKVKPYQLERALLRDGHLDPVSIKVARCWKRDVTGAPYHVRKLLNKTWRYDQLAELMHPEVPNILYIQSERIARRIKSERYLGYISQAQAASWFANPATAPGWMRELLDERHWDSEIYQAAVARSE